MTDILNKDLAKSLDVSLSFYDKGLKKLFRFMRDNTPLSRVVYKAGEVRNYFNSNYAVNILGEGFFNPLRKDHSYDLYKQRL